MGNVAWIIISSLLVNNFTLVVFLGLCSFFGVTKQIETAFKLGLANTFVLLMTALSAWFLNKYVLGPAPYLRTIAFIVVVSIARMVLSPATYSRVPSVVGEP